MYLSRILLNKNAVSFFKQPGKTVKQTETIERFRQVTAIQILNKIKSDLNESNDHRTYWDNLRRTNSDLFRLLIKNTNFENKFLDLIYDFNVKDKMMLNSLKDYFIHKKIDKSSIQKSSFGQILLMLKSIDPNEWSNQNDMIIDKIYSELRNDNLLNVKVSDNFLFEYAKSSPERFEIVCQDFAQNKVFIEGMQTRTKFMDLLFDNKKYDHFLKLLLSFLNHDEFILGLFRSKSNQIDDEQFYIRFLKAINDVQVHLQTQDIDRLKFELKRFGYKSIMIKPNSMNCPDCNELIPEMKPEAIEKLKTYFVNEFLTAAKKLNNEKSKELIEKYILFLKNRKESFDLVIDGLNIGFQGKVAFDMTNNEPEKGGIQLRTTKDLLYINTIKLLDGIVKTRMYKRILFIGRYFQSYNEELTNFFQKNNIKCRFFEKHVEDDISAILAALYSPNSRILTNDYYDDHLNKIEDLNLRRLFFEFLFSHHVTLMRRNYSLNYRNEGWIKKVHHNSKTNTLHIPFNSQNEVYRHLFTWFCFRKVN